MPSNNGKTLPLSVVIPTKNSRAYLPDHIAGLAPWLDLVQEVVLVDSFSTDGTVEYLRESLQHPRVKFLTHPPGLYASWNHAIANVESEFVFIATTGDTITREGIETLVRTIESLQCDVVISKPMFRSVDGPAEDIQWPVDDVIHSLRTTGPKKLSQLQAIVFAMTNSEAGLLGSVASDLFRTSVLKRFPFPTDFGTAGDGAWGWMHAGDVSVGVVPQKFSSFLVHPTGASSEEKRALKEARRADEVIKCALPQWKLSAEQLALVNELLGVLTTYLDAKIAFDGNRRAGVPWWLSPSAWMNRTKRNRFREQLQAVKMRALA
jgi:glycosyltransferase involved in cell wall biosynthesis